MCISSTLNIFSCVQVTQKLDEHLFITFNVKNWPPNREVIIVKDKKERWKMFGCGPHRCSTKVGKQLLDYLPCEGWQIRGEKVFLQSGVSVLKREIFVMCHICLKILNLVYIPVTFSCKKQQQKTMPTKHVHGWAGPECDWTTQGKTWGTFTVSAVL